MLHVTGGELVLIIRQIFTGPYRVALTNSNCSSFSNKLNRLPQARNIKLLNRKKPIAHFHAGAIGNEQRAFNVFTDVNASGRVDPRPVSLGGLIAVAVVDGSRRVACSCASAANPAARHRIHAT